MSGAREDTSAGAAGLGGADGTVGRTAEMIFTGDELLRGDIVNSNQAFLGEKLLDLGLLPTRALSVLDDQKTIASAIRESLGRAPAVLLISGGLGPTEDDLTREAVSEALHRPLVHHEELLQQVRARFDHLQLTMGDSNRKQALLPEGAAAIPFTGTAPGFWVMEGTTLVAALPGVPGELRHMWQETLVPLIRALLDGNQGEAGWIVRRLRVYGIGESTAAEALGDLPWRGGEVDVGTRATLEGLTFILRARTTLTAQRELDRIEEHIRSVLRNKVFGVEGETLAEVTGRLLQDRGLTLAVAESCTGGLLAKLVTDIPGSSTYFLGGAVTYSNELKTRLLGVEQELLESHGAVSEPVAAAMARGVRERLQADCGLSITGIAGPEGGTAEKPVGLVYIGCAIGDDVRVRRFLLFRSREEIRTRAAQTALDVLRRRLLEG